MVASFCDVQDGERLGSLAAGDEERTDTALERCHPVLDRCLGRIHDAGIDVAELLEREQVGRMIRVVEGVRRCLINGQCTRVRGRIRCLASVDLPCFE